MTDILVRLSEEVAENRQLKAEVERLRDMRLAEIEPLRAALREIADIAEGSCTVNSLPHLAKIARAALEGK